MRTLKGIISLLFLCFLGILLSVSKQTQAETVSSKNIDVNYDENFPKMIGQIQIHITKYSDSLVDLARNNGLGFTEITAANPGIDPWVPGAHRKIILPTAHIVPRGPREGILINLADQRLYLFDENRKTVQSVPLGIGNAGWDTPKGVTKVVRKQHLPTWYVPKSVRLDQPELPAVIGPGPDNPLGTHAVYLDWPAYLFHGTNKPYGVGRRVSHGCIRLYPEDIVRLFDKIKIGTKVTIIDQPMKLAFVNGRLWLEVHPDQIQADEIEQKGKLTPTKPPEFEYLIVLAAGNNSHLIDWTKARTVAKERRGIPIQILK
ncbi:MAG: L,D-transpeptidase family protein [Pseudomonadota bacterium]|nr:L,D-transpeptidase family protein [Pseudomonadota bacterium]